MMTRRTMINVNVENYRLVGSCNACGGADSSGDVYEFILQPTRFRGLSFRLCQKCSGELIKGLAFFKVPLDF